MVRKFSTSETYEMSIHGLLFEAGHFGKLVESMMFQKAFESFSNYQEYLLKDTRDPYTQLHAFSKGSIPETINIDNCTDEQTFVFSVLHT